LINTSGPAPAHDPAAGPEPMIMPKAGTPTRPGSPPSGTGGDH